jgi:hypothetical protein
MKKSRSISAAIEEAVLAGGEGEIVDRELLEPEDFLSLEADVGGLSLGPAPGLMDEDAGGGEGEALSLRAAGEDEGGHGSGLADAIGLDVGLDALDRIVEGEAGRHGTAGRVDVDRDVLLGILRLEEEELGYGEVGRQVVDLAVDEDDPVLEEAGVDVVGPLADARLLDDDGHQVMHSLVHGRIPHCRKLLRILEQVHEGPETFEPFFT